MKIAFLESLGIEWVLSNLEGFVQVQLQKREFEDNFLLFMHFGGSQSWVASIG